MATSVGVVHLSLKVAQATSLKDKRRIIKGFKDRVRGKHNVSIAEVDDQDNHRSAVLAVAIVSSDRRYAEGVLQKIVDAAGTHRDMILTDHEIDWL
jgi:hypothetical protein